MKKRTTIIQAMHSAEIGTGMVRIRNPITRGQIPIEYFKLRKRR